MPSRDGVRRESLEDHPDDACGPAFGRKFADEPSAPPPAPLETVKERIGNPLFAIETNLEPLAKRIREGRTDEALEILDEIRLSVTKVKEALHEL
jgi:hypothetical protein